MRRLAIACVSLASAAGVVLACGAFDEATPEAADGGPETGVEPIPDGGDPSPSTARNIYVAGGLERGLPVDVGPQLNTLTTSVLVASVRDDGSLTPWSETTPLPRARYNMPGVAAGDGFFVIAGEEGVDENNSTATSEVLRASYLANGALGPWETQAALPRAIYRHGTALDRGALYVFGGSAINTPSLAEVSFGRISIGATVQQWTAGAPLPGARRSFAVAKNVNTIYLVGGSHVTDGGTEVCDPDILAGKTGTGGQLEPWTSTNVTFTKRRAAAAALAGRLYIAGGVACGGTFSREVWSAEITLGGALGALRKEADLPRPLTAHGMVAARGTLFVVGGDEGDSWRAEVWAANPDARGAIGAWRAEAPLPRPRGSFAIDAR